MRGCILLDLDGVLYEGEAAVPGAAKAVEWIAGEGIPHLFLTNTTSRPRSALVNKLAGFGARVDAGQILTPAVAAATWLRNAALEPIVLFVPEATKQEFEEFSVLPEGAEKGARAIVVGDLGGEWDFPTLNRAFRLLISGSGTEMIALGMTRYWRAADGLRLDVAPFVKALEHASGVTARVLGKPAPDFYRAALARLGCAPQEAIMVGDDIYGDIDAAQKLGLRGIQVRTGKFRPADLERGIIPFATLDSIASLPAWWRTQDAGRLD